MLLKLTLFHGDHKRNTQCFHLLSFPLFQLKLQMSPCTRIENGADELWIHFKKLRMQEQHIPEVVGSGSYVCILWTAEINLLILKQSILVVRNSK